MKHIKLFEEFTANRVTCDNCGWSWRLQEGGNDVYVCHECDHDNSPTFIKEAEEKSTSREKLENSAVNTGLDKKAKASGVSIGILRAVMRRGMGAWNSSHYEGMSQEGWGYARVNGFLEKGKGTWGGADADLAKEVIASGNDKKLPYKEKD